MMGSRELDMRFRWCLAGWEWSLTDDCFCLRAERKSWEGSFGSFTRSSGGFCFFYLEPNPVMYHPARQVREVDDVLLVERMDADERFAVGAGGGESSPIKACQYRSFDFPPSRSRW